MNVTLPKDLVEFVQKEVAAGKYPDSNSVVVDALRGLRSKKEGVFCRPELKALLLEAVNGPHHPMTGDYFEK